MDSGVGMLGCCRLSITRQPAPAAPPCDHAAMLALRTPAADRTPAQKAALFAAWRSSVAELKPLNNEIDALRNSTPQGVTSVPQLLERDPRNAWLARGPRFRADAEVIRDIALSASGLLTNKLGGPAVIPPVPQNVLDYNFTYPTYWKPAEGPERYRRTLYGFRKRSMPDPVMANFDGPNGDFACARRPRTNTPLAALTGLNEPIFVEAARALALRILREGGADDVRRIDYALLLCVSRPARPAERETLLALLRSTRRRLAEGWLN